MTGPNQTETDGKGESEPIETTTTTEGKAKNRRVEFLKLKTLLSEFSEAFTKRMLEERKKAGRMFTCRLRSFSSVKLFLRKLLLSRAFLCFV